MSGDKDLQRPNLGEDADLFDAHHFCVKHFVFKRAEEDGLVENFEADVAVVLDDALADVLVIDLCDCGTGGSSSCGACLH